MVAVTWICCLLRLLCSDRPGVAFKARIPSSSSLVVLREVIGADSGRQLSAFSTAHIGKRIPASLTLRNML